MLSKLFVIVRDYSLLLAWALITWSICGWSPKGWAMSAGLAITAANVTYLFYRYFLPATDDNKSSQSEEDS